MAGQNSKDHWSSTAYTASASFVPQLASAVSGWLNPQASDTILDLGCGDGPLTAEINEKCSNVVGVDASVAMIEAAKKSYGNIAGLTWYARDCRYLERDSEIGAVKYDKVFSNAALHWILRDPSTRMSVLKTAYGLLKPGGVFVFEMGGAGNVADAHTALLAAVVHQGLSIAEARNACPWFFPSEKWMKQMLEEVGFEVERSETEYRPTKLTTEKEGGLEGWARLMGAQFLEALPTQEKRESAVREVCDTLQSVLTHEEDGSMWLGYVRLRVLARKA
ncbi:MAG: hypothetical protein LQ347_005366 [Umbilicaria vellea]|nr:MAG: hypothetical protein LQ347_005366 [Umbilicaria vellea]